MILRFITLIALAVSMHGAANWSEPFPPHRVAGNVYYVGSKGLAAYLITTTEGHILINTNLSNSLPLIERSVRQLGFRLDDVRIILISHAHFDHCAGSSAMKQRTHARYMVMDADVPEVEDGGKSDFAYGGKADMRFPPTPVDRVLHDGYTVALGGVVLTAHLTPGHTKGCTTWTLRTEQGGKTYRVVIVGSPNVNSEYKLVNNRVYPNIASDFEKGLSALEALPCDIFLGAHGEYYEMWEKYAKWKAGQTDAFVDPAGYRKFVKERKRAFEIELKRQQAEAATR